MPWLTALAWVLLLPPIGLVVTIAAERFLGARRGWLALLIAGVLGTGLGVITGGLLSGWHWSSLDMVLSSTTFAVIYTMVLALAFDVLRPEGTLSQGQASGRVTVTNPLASARRRLQPLQRYREVLQIAERHGVVSRDLGHRDLPAEVRATLEEAGGIFVKLGQVASTRTDVLPSEWCAELSHLRSHVSAIPRDTMEPFIEAQLEHPVDEVFSSFEWEPIAAASIAQVYHAHHPEFGDVVVKVRRPGLEHTFDRDSEAIRQLADLIERRTMLGLEIRPVGLADEFLDEVAEELDFRIEAANALEFAVGLSDEGGVRVPRIYTEVSGECLMVEEFIDAPSISTLANTDGAAAAVARIVDSFLYQLFELGAFHADPHPGNILVEHDGTIVLIDLGAIGRIGPQQRGAVLDMLVAAASGESTAVRQALAQFTVFDARVDGRELDAALDAFLVRNMRAGDGISAATFEDLTVLIGEFGISLPRWFGVLIRTLVTLEGTLVGLQPDFSLVDAARARAEHRGFRPTGGSWREAIEHEALAQLPRLRRVPERLDELLGQAVSGGIGVRVSAFSDERDEQIVTRLVDRLVLAIIAASTGVGAVLLLGVDGGPTLGGSVAVNELIGYLGLGASAVLSMRVVAGVIRDGET
ncbi:MAG: AarF/UbiB family protein [Actinomycetota bacterium]